MSFRTAAPMVAEPLLASAAALRPKGLGGVVVGACSLFDRLVLDHFIRRRPVAAPAGLRERLERAARFYGDRGFIDDPEAFFAPPTALGVVGSRRLLGFPDGELLLLDYETDFEPVFPEARGEPLEEASRRGVALWWRHAEPGHPVTLCVHGYGGGHVWLESLAFDAIRFYRAGIDVLIYVLPHHGARTPRGARHSGETFFDMDLVRTTEAFARAIYELRALARHVRTTGTGPVGAFGMSLGAYTVGLLASVDPALAFVAAMIPIVSFVERWWGEGSADPWLTIAVDNGWSRAGVQAILGVHEPIARPALVPHDRRLVIGALGDGICTPEQAEMLWRHWDRPRMHWYAGGHLVQLGRGAALRAVRALVREVPATAAVPESPLAPAGAARSSRPPRRIWPAALRAARRPRQRPTGRVRRGPSIRLLRRPFGDGR